MVHDGLQVRGPTRTASDATTASVHGGIRRFSGMVNKRTANFKIILHYAAVAPQTLPPRPPLRILLTMSKETSVVLQRLKRFVWSCQI